MSKHKISNTEARLAHIKEWEKYRAKAIEYLKRKDQRAYRYAKTRAANEKIREANEELRQKEQSEKRKIKWGRLAELSKLFKERVLENIQEWCETPEQREKVEGYITRLFSSEDIESDLNKVLDKSENGSLRWNIRPSKYSGYGLNERKKDIIERRWLLKQTYREIGAAWKISGTRVTQLERQALNTIYQHVIVKIISAAWMRDNQPIWLGRLKG